MAITGFLSEVFIKSLDSVRPDRLVRKHLTRKGDCLFFGDQYHQMNQDVYVVGFGKAVSGMYAQVQSLIHDHIARGVISVPSTMFKDLKSSGKLNLWPVKDDRTTIYEGAYNNISDEVSRSAAKAIAEVCGRADEDDLVIVLISGGGSALLPLPIPPITLKEKVEITQQLAAKGASIKELNIVRKSLSFVKGGKLARLAYPAQVWSLIISDVVGNEVSSIASGPTMYEDELANIHKAESIIKAYDVIDAMPTALKIALERAKLRISEEGVKRSHHVLNGVIGSNILCLDSVQSHLRRENFFPLLLSDSLEASSHVIGRFFINLTAHIKNCIKSRQIGKHTNFQGHFQELGLPLSTSNRFMTKLDEAIGRMLKFPGSGIAVVAGGESVTSLCANPGQGGRNQEIVLSFLSALTSDDQFEVNFLSCGTDGQDGPTPAAGAVVSSLGPSFDLLDAEDSLNRNDSHGFFVRRGEGLVVTGATGTNVMDVQVLTIKHNV